MSVHQKSNGTWYVRWREPRPEKKGKYKERKHYTAKGREGEHEARTIDAAIFDGKKQGYTPEFIIAKHTGKQVEAQAAAQAIERQGSGDFSYTFAGLSAEWIKSLENKDYRYNVSRALQKWAMPLFGQKKIAELSMADLVNMNSAMLDVIDDEETGKKTKPATVATRNRYRTYARRALEWGVQNELITANPFAPFHPNKEDENAAPDLITPEELAAIISKAAPHLKWAIRCALNLGVRPGMELFSIEMKHCEPENKVVMVRRIKDKAARRVLTPQPIPKGFADQITGLKKREPERVYLVEYTARYPGKMLSRSGLKTSWTNAKERAGITRRLRLHDLRHLYATRLAQSGVDSKLASKLLGHRDARMVQKVYRHIVSGELRDAVDRLPEW